MRRSEKEITDRNKIDEIINNSLICRLGLSKDNIPYVLPISFGYSGEYLYFHTAEEGRKIDYIESNKQVCAQFEKDVQLVTHDKLPCKWTFAFESVLCFGEIEEVLLEKEKIYALNQIMVHYSGKEWENEKYKLHKLRVWKMKIKECYGKESKIKEE